MSEIRLAGRDVIGVASGARLEPVIGKTSLGQAVQPAIGAQAAQAIDRIEPIGFLIAYQIGLARGSPGTSWRPGSAPARHRRRPNPPPG